MHQLAQRGKKPAASRVVSSRKGMGSPRESFLPQGGLGGPGGSDLSARFQAWTQKLNGEMLRTFRAFLAWKKEPPHPPSGTASVYLERILQTLVGGWCSTFFGVWVEGL